MIHRDNEEFDSHFKKPNAAHRMYRNADPRLHPLENAREIQRAIVAVKMEKMFSKPLVGVLDGHRDAVRCISRCHHRLTDIFTGSCDGEIRHWDIAQKTCLRSIRAHDGFVRGLTISQDDALVYSCGDDGIVRGWQFTALGSLPTDEDFEAKGNLVRLSEDDTEALKESISPVKTWNASGPLTAIDHHWSKGLFLTTGEALEIWDTNRSAPVHSFDWGHGVDVICSGRFNRAETNLIAASGGDNGVCLFDLRTSSAIRKVILQMRTNSLSWNPMQPLLFTCANEDGNLYTFDMRSLDHALVVHKDFTNAVLDVDYSPTGREFVAASFDQTIRIFPSDKGRSRDIYHGKRMQIALSCCYSADSKFVLSGSADFCVRIWKSKAWEALGPKTLREKRVLAYREALKERHKHVPEVRRILSHHHVPKLVKKLSEKKTITATARKRAEINRQLHSKLGTVPDVAEKKRVVRKLED